LEEAGKSTIIVSQNDEETRHIYTDVLSKIGRQILEAGNAYEAFDYLGTHTVSLIVTDLHMPGGGLQYLSTLRERTGLSYRDDYRGGRWRDHSPGDVDRRGHSVLRETHSGKAAPRDRRSYSVLL
jgi:CheY-like chemotaxis protein